MADSDKPWIPGRPEPTGAKPDLERRKMKKDVERMMLYGTVAASDVMLRYDMDEQTARELMLEIRKEWRTQLDNHDDRRQARIEQLNGIIQKAMAAFDRSKKDVERVKIDIVTCDACNGRKMVGPKDDPTPCPACDATGKMRKESVSIEQTPGDPSFLSVAIAAVKEAGRFEGTYDERCRGIGMGYQTRMLTTASIRLDEAGTVEGIELKKEIESFYDELPEETIIGGMIALETIDRMRAERQKKAQGQTKITDTDAKAE